MNTTTQQEQYTQLCVWPGTILREGEEADFIEFMKKEFNTRVKLVGVQLTNPDKDRNGNVIPETGGRSDLFFYVHSDDVGKFAIPRLMVGIRWWEDVLLNGGAYLYSTDFLQAHPKTW